MSLDTKSRKELVCMCKERGLKGYSSKNKPELIALLNKPEHTTSPSIYRLNYIGSKFQLLSWLDEHIRKFTGFERFDNLKVADLFSGTGIVSYHFRSYNSEIIANDVELYSSIISHAFARSVYTDKCKIFLETTKGKTIGFITKNYSPYENCERKFFEASNAMAIDYARKTLEETRTSFNDDEYNFLLASIIVSADAVSNVPAVYGCYLKEFKAKAKKAFVLKPIHTNTIPGHPNSIIHNIDVLSLKVQADIVYLDPPYNERQYSKNYFPLGVLALSPSKQDTLLPLKGKTGIPEECFISTFCQKDAEKAIEKLFSNLKAKYVFLSYNSEGIVPLEKLIEIGKTYGNVEVFNREYKRFKSFEYEKKVEENITEYLICVQMNA